MLQSIRDKTSGWIAYLIVFLISIPFALWGVNSYLGGGEVPPAATVDGQEITLQNLDGEYARYRQRLTQMFGGQIPGNFGDEDLMKEQVLSQIIEEYALRSYAEKNRYRISDLQLNQAIRSMEVFYTDGTFDAELYQRQIASLGYSAAGFESNLRRTQAMEQLQTGISATAFNIPASLEKLNVLSNQTRTVRLLTSPISLGDVTISEEDIQSHFDKNQSRYMTEEQVKINYIDISLEGIKTAIDVDLDQVRSRYDQNINIYTSEELRTASHILLTLSADASIEESQESENKLIDLRLQIEAGADFAELAEQHSQDPVSAEEGGDLGEIERGTMVQSFETALFELEPGQVSQPVKTSFGWHLIKLTDAKGGDTQPFDSVRNEIEDEIRTELAESQIYDLTENLANLAYEQPDSLLPAAEQLGLDLQTSDWFSRFTGEGIAADQKVRNAAFNSDVLTEGLNSEAIELADSRIVFIHLNEHKPAAPRNLDEVREEIVAEMRQNKARKDNVAIGKAALESINSGGSLESVAKDWQADVVEPPTLSRNSSDVDGNLVKLAFSMAKPDGKSVIQGYSHANGDYTLVELVAVNITETPLSDEQKTSLRTAVAGQEYQSVLKLVGSRADVVRTPTSELESGYGGGYGNDY